MNIYNKKINDKNYNEIVMKTENPFLLLFTSQTCPHCRTVEGFMEKIKDNYSNVDLYIIESEKSPKLLEKFGIMSFPSTQFVSIEKKGVKRIVGAAPAEDFFKAFKLIIKKEKRKGFFSEIFGDKK
jgi:thiol-disulfide isomerase/thioredoxin